MTYLSLSHRWKKQNDSNEVWVLTQRCAIIYMLAFQQEEDTFNIFRKVILVSLVGEAIGQGPRNRNPMISEISAY